MRSKSRKLALTIALGLALAGFAPSAAASNGPSGCPLSIHCVRFSWIQGFNDPATPDLSLIHI